KTANYIALGRALAEVAAPETGFSDVTAYALLPAEARERVDRFRSGQKPRGVRQKLERALLLPFSAGMAVRSLAIDEAVRAARNPQVVILGAGLDGRAWRMTELAN